MQASRRNGDGNRVQETVAGIKALYEVAEVNPTGYAQVIEERGNAPGGVQVIRDYIYGLELLRSRTLFNGNSAVFATAFYGMDGHGSVRYLTNETGTVTDTYDYDAFGNLINQTGSTANNYLFAGEQFDPGLGIYYNRARYYDQRQGRFWTMDTYEGDPESPGSIHKYLYGGANAINRVDPTGNDSIAELGAASAIDQSLSAIATVSLPSGGGGPAAQIISRLLIPQSVWQDLLAFTPDAVEVGASVSGSVNLRMPIGLTAGGGAEFLMSPKTGNWAFYSYVSPVGLSFDSTATSIGGSATAGLVYRCPNSDKYGGQFYTATVPMAVIPTNVRTKIAGDWAIAPFQGIGATIPPPYTSLLAAMRYAFGNAFSSNGAINIFISPDSPHAVGFSLALGKSWLAGVPTSNWSAAWSYYWQDAPSGTVSFR